VTCNKLGEHLGMLDDAIAEGSCDEVEGQQSDAVCNAFTKAIPPCMVLKGGAKQSECLAEKASELGDADIVSNCKCKAFRNIKNTVGSVKNMMCIDSRESRSFGYGYGMNTIWFQYLLCKDMSFACYFFTQGWNQGDFGQYYLYDNLLDSSGLTDDTLLTLAVVGGGLGGGYRPQYAPTHGHYYPPPPEPEPESEPEHEPEPVPLHRRRRSSSDEPITEASTSRRRRQATATEASSSLSRRRRQVTPTEASPSRRRRQVTPTEASPSPSRRRRQVTPSEASPSPSRRRRQVTSTDASPSRRRRQVTSTEASPSRRRRDAPTTESSSKPTLRRRRSCCDPDDDEVCDSDQALC